MGYMVGKNKNIKLFQQFFNHIPTPTAITNIGEGRYEFINHAFTKTLGYTEKEVIGRTSKELNIFRNYDDRSIASNEIKEKGYFENNELNVIKKDGEMITLLFSGETVTLNGDVYLITVAKDITERKKKEEEIAFLTFHDVLTGLYNRTFFEDKCSKLDEIGQPPISVIVGDVNGLKLTNDAFGHRYGDQLLCTVSDIIIKSLRTNDIATRVGGDEFCIILPNTDSDIAKQICDHIYTACENTELSIGGIIYNPSISLGLATKYKFEQPISEIFIKAEDSMYKRKLLDSKSTHSSLITNIRTTMFEKSHETREHADRIAALAKKVGLFLNLPYDQLSDIELLGTLHDIGKIGIDGQILDKNTPLSEDEWIEMKKHPEIGYRIALASSELISAAEGILCHHERWDGKGYPQGISGENIPLSARIVSVVDAFDAMTHERVYRSAMSLDQAKKEIAHNAGKQFDPVVVEAFLSIVDQDNI